jgi:hypothetical protein
MPARGKALSDLGLADATRTPIARLMVAETQHAISTPDASGDAQALDEREAGGVDCASSVHSCSQYHASAAFWRDV